jgi:PAS domain S-box-containing protein
MMLHANKITVRLLAGFLLLSPLPIAGLSWFYMQRFEQTLKAGELKKLSSIADKKTNQINTYLNERLTDSRAWAASPLLITVLQTFTAEKNDFDSPRRLAREKPYQDYIDTLRLEESGYQDLMLTDTSGTVVFSTRSAANLGLDLNKAADDIKPLALAHRAALSTGTTQITPVYAGPRGQYALFIVTPVVKDEQRIGTLDLQVDINRLAAVAIDTTGLGNTGITALGQAQGRQTLLIAQLQRFSDAGFYHAVPFDQTGKAMQTALAGKSGQGISQDFADKEIIGAWRYLPALHWGMVVRMDTTEALAPLHRLQKTLAITLALSLLLAGLVAVLFGRALIAPIKKLITATGQIASGNLDQRAPVIGWAELQQLATSFNRMADHVQTSYAALETQVTQRTAELTKALNLAKEAQHIAHLGNWEHDQVSGNMSWSDEIFTLLDIDPSGYVPARDAFIHATHPEDREMVAQSYLGALQNHIPYYELTHRLLMPDGRVKWVRERISSEFDATGKALRSVGTMQDITTRRRVEIALMQSESLFRTLTEVSPAGIFRSDADGNFTYVNEQLCKLAGITAGQAMGAGWIQAIHPEERTRIAEAWMQSVENRTAFQQEFRYKRPTGHITWVVCQAKAELGERGEVRGFVGTITDINERKQNEEALLRFNEELEQRVEQRTAMLLTAKEEAEAASRSKSRFLASMSHELRTPLNAILGYAQLMQMDTELPAQAIENAAEINRAGDHLLTLLNDVLDLARIDAGNLGISIKTHALSDIVQACRTRNNPQAASRRITLRCDDSCNPFVVEADNQRLAQVLNNLISNAIKYNSEGGSVTLSAETRDHRVRILVTDSGPGISPEQQKTLFQPFNRLGAELGAIEGAGIGLAIARRLMEAMHGSIGVISTEGAGSTFWVELPGAGTEHPAGTQPHILVAEDYPPNQNVLRMQLQALGCTVDIAANGREALAKYQCATYDLILTDLNMPVMNGLALAQAIRESEPADGKRIPIIALTAAAEADELLRCRTAGIDDTLTKPISLGGLSNILAHWVGLAAVSLEKTANPRTDAILDIEHLYHHLGKIDFTQAQSLIATFISAANEALAHPAHNDPAAIAREMHKQKSAARTVGALHYAHLAETLEYQIHNGQSAQIRPALADLKKALDEVTGAALMLQKTASDSAPVLHAVTTLSCVLVIDDDPVVVQQMRSLLAALGVPDILSAQNGMEAMEALLTSKGNIDLLLCDLNMPEMDGVELIRNISRTGFSGGMILMSGADEKVLETVSKLAGLQGLHVLGHLRKPVAAANILPLLSLSCKLPEPARPASSAPVITQDDIIAGMNRGEFFVCFQPKVNSSSLRAVGVEALARWRRQDGELVPPDIFITVAEQTGVIGGLSQMLLAIAFSEGAKLVQSGYSLKIAVNLSGRWLNDLSLPDFILDRTQEAGLKAGDVILEVTETGVLEDLTTALDVLTRLRLKGFGLSIDDFGIGYSSFEQLGRIPFTEMKLDRSFVSRATQDAASRAILESSMDMANKLGLSTVAEGVETQQDLEFVRSLGCELLQGYLIARPMLVEELLNWLHQNAAAQPDHLA